MAAVTPDREDTTLTTYAWKPTSPGMTDDRMTDDIAHVPGAHRTMYDAYSDTCREILARRSGGLRLSRRLDRVPPDGGHPLAETAAAAARDGSAADVA
jgi:hypothetical protein